MPTRTVRVPDIGEFENVDVVEILVQPGERVEREASLIVIESDKASMEVPSPAAGVVGRLLVAVNDQVSEGHPILELEVAEGEATREPADARAETPPSPAVSVGADLDHAEVLVLGGGPGGYTTAFRAADLGKQVVLVERFPALGGVCLNVGCIPSKALLHMAAVIEEAAALQEHGVDFGKPRLDFERIRARKDEVVGTLTKGLSRLAKQRRVRVLTGTGRLTGPHEMAVTSAEGETRVAFDAGVLATGSRSVELPGLPRDPRIQDSTAALEVAGPPGRLLVVGGGIIGLEMASVYAAFGWRVSVVELLAHLMDGADRDLVRPLQKRLEARTEQIWLETAVAGIEARATDLQVRFEGAQAPASACFDQVLIAVGRRPNGDAVGAEAAGIEVDPRGFIAVDAQQRTGVSHLYAIGDLTGPPMLAHKASHEGKTAAEVIAGLPARFDPRAIPSVAYTDPEVAWTGLTETAARAQGIAVRKGLFPWSASGRALGIGRGEGLTKLLFSQEDGQLLGAGIVGARAGDLIAEATLAIELGADAQDIGLTVHPHPTLSETVAFAAEMAAGTITDLLPPRERKQR